MKAKYKGFILPHIGDSYSLCADRFDYSEETKSFAIVDGVGNSLFPDAWAEIVVHDFVENPDNFHDGHNRLVREAQLIEKWTHKANERTQNLTEEQRFIFEMGLDKADFAACTFVGLQFYKDNWICEAIGDSYLFVLDKDCNILDSVSSMKGHEFDNFPEYFASKEGYNNGTTVKSGGKIGEVCRFALMTDALSDWFLDAAIQKEDKLRLLDVHSHDEYQKLIETERQQGRLKDDDTTMLVITLEEDDNEELTFEKEEIDEISDFIKQESGADETSAITDIDDGCIEDSDIGIMNLNSEPIVHSEETSLNATSECEDLTDEDVNVLHKYLKKLRNRLTSHKKSITTRREKKRRTCKTLCF